LISVFNKNVYEPTEFDNANPVVKKVGIIKQTLDIGRPIRQVFNIRMNEVKTQDFWLLPYFDSVYSEVTMHESDS